MEISNDLKQEAIKRMQLLKIHKNAVNEFEKEGKLNKSETMLGSLYWLNEKEQDIVKHYQDKTNVLVYHIIHSFSNIGETYDLLFVSNNQEEWDAEKEDLKNGFAYTQTIVVSYEYDNEEGYIGVKSINGGLVRAF